MSVDDRPFKFFGSTTASVAHIRVHTLNTADRNAADRNTAAFRRSDTLGDKGLRAYIPAPHQNPAWWCNGSTSDSESLSRGSNPRRAIEQHSLSDDDSGCFFFDSVSTYGQQRLAIEVSALIGHRATK